MSNLLSAKQVLQEIESSPSKERLVEIAHQLGLEAHADEYESIIAGRIKNNIAKHQAEMLLPVRAASAKEKTPLWVPVAVIALVIAVVVFIALLGSVVYGLSKPYLDTPNTAVPTQLVPKPATQAAPKALYTATIPQWAQPTVWTEPGFQNRIGPMDSGMTSIAVYEEVEKPEYVALKIHPTKNEWISSLYVCRPASALKTGQSNPNGCETPAPPATATPVPFDVKPDILELPNGKFRIQGTGFMPKSVQIILLIAAGEEKLFDGAPDANDGFEFAWPSKVKLTSEAYSVRLKYDLAIVRQMNVKRLPVSPSPVP